MWNSQQRAKTLIHLKSKNSGNRSTNKEEKYRLKGNIIDLMKMVIFTRICDKIKFNINLTDKQNAPWVHESIANLAKQSTNNNEPLKLYKRNFES